VDVTERQHDNMTKRPSLFATKPAAVPDIPTPEEATTTTGSFIARPPSRAGKRVLSVYLDPLAWKQLRQLALDSETTTQALGEEAVNLLFAKHGINRSA
jgi:hypothetical protein